MPGTRKLGKTTDQRMAMLRQQVTDFLDNGRMETTVTPARARSSAPKAAFTGRRINWCLGFIRASPFELCIVNRF